MREINIDGVVSGLFLLIIVMLLLIAGYFYLLQQREKESLEFANMYNELLEEKYNNLKAVYEANAKLFHDFKHHIRTINELINENHMAELKEYISEFELETLSNNNIQWTEDTIVNLVLNNKISMGTQKGIAVCANINYPVKTNILSKDITTILANLFDNALEACDKISEGQEKWIHVTIKSINNMLLIKLENSCCEEPKIKGQRFISRKMNHQIHGWGLKSVESTAQKYNGTVTANYSQEKQVFQSVVNLFFREMEISKEYRGKYNDKSCYL